MMDMLIADTKRLPFGSDECGKFLRSTYKYSIDEVTILPDNMYEHLEEFDYLVSEINKLETMKKSIEHRLQNEMKNSDTGFCKDRKITWKTVEKTSLDSKKIKAEMPEIYDQYAKTTRSRVFRVSK